MLIYYGIIDNYVKENIESVMEKLKVGLLFGGVSSEHAVSCLSAASIIPNIPRDEYELLLVGITADGRWLRYDGDVDHIADDSWHTAAAARPCFLSPDRSIHGFVELLEDGSTLTHRVDVIFPVLHGKNGEDGTLQGLLMMAGIPFVGCDMLSSAVCMDKAVANMLMDHAGIRRAEWRFITKAQRAEREAAFIAECEQALGYPMFIKPANAGSSVGVSKVRNAAEFAAAIEEAFLHDSKVLAERAIVGKEIECAVLGNDKPVASIVGEIAPAEDADFYDYEEKYINGNSSSYIPARVSEEAAEEMRRIAVEAYQMLGCGGLSRVDFLYETATGIPYLNELNTLPGFTSISMYPKLMDASGVPYPELLSRVIRLALERTEEI